MPKKMTKEEFKQKFRIRRGTFKYDMLQVFGTKAFTRNGNLREEYIKKAIGSPKTTAKMKEKAKTYLKMYRKRRTIRDRKKTFEHWKYKRAFEINDKTRKILKYKYKIETYDVSDTDMFARVILYSPRPIPNEKLKQYYKKLKEKMGAVGGFRKTDKVYFSRKNEKSYENAYVIHVKNPYYKYK